MRYKNRTYIKILFCLGFTIFPQVILTSCLSTEITIHNINSEGIYPVESGRSEWENSFIDYLVETFGDTSSTNTVLVILFDTNEPPMDVGYITIYDSRGIRGYEVHGIDEFYLKSMEPTHYSEKFVRNILDENMTEIVKSAGSPTTFTLGTYKINYIDDHFKVKVAYIGNSYKFEAIPYFSDFGELKN